MVGGRIGFAFLTFPTLGLPYPRGATQLQQIVPCAFPPDAAGPQPAALPRPASRQQKPPPRAVPSAPESSRNPAATDGDRRKGHPRPGRGQQLAPWRKRVAPHRLPCIHIYVCKAVCWQNVNRGCCSHLGDPPGPTRAPHVSRAGPGQAHRVGEPDHGATSRTGGMGRSESSSRP